MSEFAEQFEDLGIWQQARVFSNNVYDVLEKCRDFSFRDQICRAATSSMNNIAEGFEHRTPKDFGHFLDIAKGSSGEVRSMLYLAEDRKYVETDLAVLLREKAKTLSAGIAALRRRL
jgi:four helix bundle protein